MTRAIDICTCGLLREEHGLSLFGLDDHQFMPHPQPQTRPEKGVREKLEDFIWTIGQIQSRSGLGYLVRTFDGEVWEINVFKRSTDTEDGV